LEQTIHECPLCPGKGRFITTFQGAYDHAVNRITFQRHFFRCQRPKCGAVFYFDEFIRQDENTHWKAEHIEAMERFEQRREELLDTEVYQTMMRAREESNDIVTKDRALAKQVKEIDTMIAQEKEDLENFNENMRNFEWVDNAAIENWIESNWLPPSFAEKSMDSDFGMSRPLLRNDLPQEVREEWQRDDENPCYQEGQPIHHELWGTGKVLSGNLNGGTIITAEFPQQGKKTMDLRFAKIQAVSGATNP